MVLDEFGHAMDKDSAKTFSEAILPMMVVGHRALLCITTAPKGKAGGYHELFKVKDDYGNSVFKYYEIRTVCRPCYDKGIRLKCKHLADRVPQHHSEERQSKLEKIMKALGQSDTFERENAGITTSMDDRVFPGRTVDMAFGSRPYRAPDHHEYSYVCISIDPNFGPINVEDSATASDFAIVTTYYTFKRRFMLFGTSAWVCRLGVDEYAPHLLEHHRRIRATPALKNAIIFVVPECKAANEDRYIHKILSSTNDPKIRWVKEATEKIGVPTNHKIKREMAVELREMLREGVVNYDQNMFSTTPGWERTPEKDREKLRHQLRDYKEQIVASKDPFKPHTVHYSGKPHKDDLAVALQLNLKYFLDFLQNPKYEKDREL